MMDEVKKYVERKPFQRYELEAFIGDERLGDYDVDAIIDELTEVDGAGNRWWRYDADRVINDVCFSHEL